MLTLCFQAVLFLNAAFAQQSTDAEKSDSILAVLMQLQGSERLDALRTLINLNYRTLNERRYTRMYIEEAAKQKNIQAEGWGRQNLMSTYYAQFETDSVFIVGEEAIRFNRQHQLYSNVFYVRQQLIKRYLRDGKLIIALRKAEEAFEEAKEIQQNILMGLMLAVIGEVHYFMEQFEEAVGYYVESVEMGEKSRDEETSLYFVSNYNYLIYLSRQLKRPDEMLRYTDSLQVELERFARKFPDVPMDSYHFLLAYNRAITYAKLGQSEQAMQAIQHAETFYNPQWNNRYHATQINEMYAEYYLLTGNYDKALEHIGSLQKYYEDKGPEFAFQFAKKDYALALFEMGDYKNAAQTYSDILVRKDSVNVQRFYAQINEFRAIFQLDRAEMEVRQHLADIRHQRMVNRVLSIACFALIIIVTLVLWNRKRIAKKNRGLYLQIVEQDKLSKELEAERRKNQTNAQGKQSEPSENETEEELFARLDFIMKERRLFLNPDIKRQDVAEIIGLGDRALHNYIKNNTGANFSQYVIGLRLSYACELLLTVSEKYTIEAIALEAGFSSRPTFYRHFRAKYELSPEEFRKIAKEQM